jgi:hypothetical protein
LPGTGSGLRFFVRRHRRRAPSRSEIFRTLPNIELFDNFILDAQGKAATDPNSA